MSARPRKADAEEVLEQAPATPEEEAPKRRRGRPRKNPETEENTEAAGTAAENEAADNKPAPRSNRRRRKDQEPEAAESAPSEDGQADEGGGGGSRGGRSQGRRGRRGRQSNRRQSPSFRDLQQKIVPELQLIAQEIGLEDYRKMKKDDLAVAILERSAEMDGLRLLQGFLEISSDGYGFLQESLLQNNTRSVIVSAGLIKQFKLRTGDWIMGKARRPRDNERYGTLIRVEAVNGVDPFQAAKRPRFDDLVPTFPDRMIQLETEPNE
ncbi:MAG TPA: Rho termination factor N-terminal domain-containing protein, partial [Deinococcales bacterium]|nr:Rho termination factor N-terminal domain-containing protein [Deinococcales bacterium]